MIHIAIAVGTLEAICATLPVGTAMYETETSAKGERLIRLGGLGESPFPPGDSLHG
jgi:hypothetical protein